MNLKGKVMIVTGASTGIGRDIVNRLLAEETQVLAVSRRAESMALEHPLLTKKNFDLADQKAIDALFDYAMAKYERVDAFIANAGFTYYEFLEGSDYKHIESIFKLNTFSVIYSVTKMKECFAKEGFNFIVVASAVSFLSMPGYALYSATKASLRGFMDAIRLESPKQEVYQTVFPVATKTAFFDRANQETMPWPVQTSDHVAKSIINGIKRDQKRIYPSKLFKYGFKLAPWFFTLYVKIQTRKFYKIMANREDQ